MLDISMTIEGLQAAQQAHIQLMAALKPSGAFGQAIQHATARAHRYAVAITHVDTGSLRASHRMRIHRRGLRGTVYIDPGAVNPRTGQRPADYGRTEHARGGSHAFYARTIAEEGPAILQDVDGILRRGLPR